MDLDDLPVGRVLSRREALVVLGASGSILLLGGSRSSNPSTPRGRVANPCVVRPASTAGPYYVDEKLARSDIRSDPSDGTVKHGAMLALTLNVFSIARDSCRPLKDAVVDVWQCDAEGVYSDAVDSNFDTTGKKFLRGYQVTEKEGVAKFTTIYPGWYPGRTPHIHYKIRSPASAPSPYEFIGQLYFDEAMTDRVYAKPPYAARGKRTVSNLSDRIYNRDGGRQTTLSVAAANRGYAASFDVALDRS